MGELKFILPDWDDIVDPGFDFKNERHSELYARDRYVYGARIWELLGGDVVDGVLISISTLTQSKLERIKVSGGARKFLKLPSNMQLIGDCGAWQYRYLEKPPYSIEEILRYYEVLGVDYGVTLDHIPFFGNPQERMEITFNNAVEMYRLWRSGKYGFTLMASVQGIDIEDYAKSMRELYNVGYRHFAIGGLAKRDTKFITRLITRLRDVARELGGIEKIHFLGITRLSVIPMLRDFLSHVGEVSFDSSTVLRMAWTREVGNYITIDGKAYTAIRVVESPNARQLLERLRLYDEGGIGLNEVLEDLRKYLEGIGQLRYLPYYEALLRDKPWKRCGCPICRSVGIDVVVFRGNDRNRRRGFHNVYVFKRILEDRSSIPKFVIVKGSNDPASRVNDLPRNVVDAIRRANKVLVITNCTSEKNVDMEGVLKTLDAVGLNMPSFDVELEKRYREVLRGFVRPARDLYGGSFRAVKNLVDALRASGKQVDLYIVSARYGLINEVDEVVPYEASLKGKPKDWIRGWFMKLNVEGKLMQIINSNKYDLIIMALPKEYAYAIESVLNSLVNNTINNINAILIVPKGVVKAVSGNPRVMVLLAGNLTARLKYLRRLRDALDGRVTLDQWLG